MPKVSDERLEDVIKNLERWSAATGRGDDAVMLDALRHYRELRRMNALPELSDECECEHSRSRHEYGAVGYNAASNCSVSNCDCPAFSVPPSPEEAKSE